MSEAATGIAPLKKVFLKIKVISQKKYPVLESLVNKLASF